MAQVLPILLIGGVPGVVEATTSEEGVTRILAWRTGRAERSARLVELSAIMTSVGVRLQLRSAGARSACRWYALKTLAGSPQM